MEKRAQIYPLLQRMMNHESLLRNTPFDRNDDVRRILGGYSIDQIKLALEIFNDPTQWSEFLFSDVYSNDRL